MLQQHTGRYGIERTDSTLKERERNEEPGDIGREKSSSFR